MPLKPPNTPNKPKVKDTRTRRNQEQPTKNKRKENIYVYKWGSSRIRCGAWNILESMEKGGSSNHQTRYKMRNMRRRDDKYESIKLMKYVIRWQYLNKLMNYEEWDENTMNMNQSNWWNEKMTRYQETNELWSLRWKEDEYELFNWWNDKMTISQQTNELRSARWKDNEYKSIKLMNTNEFNANIKKRASTWPSMAQRLRLSTAREDK